MSIFDSIKNAIFGHMAEAQPLPQTTQAPPPHSMPSTAAAAPPANPATRVDVDAVLTDMAKKNSQKLNWQTSIVDLMKLLGLDSSLQNRQHLAKELGYTGNTSDSAAMNIWLQKQVMLKLEQSGGVVPASLKQ